MPTIGQSYKGFYIKSEIYKTESKSGYKFRRAICVCEKCLEEKDRIISVQMKCGNCKYAERIFDRGDYYDIALSNGGFTKIDKGDLPKMEKYLWYKTIRNSVESRVGYTLVKLHRLILSPKPEEHIDHINNDTTDNRKSNLRICTQAENNRNIQKQKGCTSKYKYVYKQSSKVWIARMSIFGRKIYKAFDNERDAAIWIDIQITNTGDPFKKTNKMLGLL